MVDQVDSATVKARSRERRRWQAYSQSKAGRQTIPSLYDLGLQKSR